MIAPGRRNGLFWRKMSGCEVFEGGSVNLSPLREHTSFREAQIVQRQLQCVRYNRLLLRSGRIQELEKRRGVEIVLRHQVIDPPLIESASPAVQRRLVIPRLEHG